MSEQLALLAALILWPLIGFGLAFVLRGRGHDPVGWLLLGMLLGPLEVAHGRPATALQALVAREGYDLLVVGTSEREPKDLMGDAARDLATKGTVPVLLVPPEKEDER